jgi:protease-4
MKSFFKIVLATFVAIVIAAIVAVFLLFGFIGAIAASSDGETAIKPNSVFRLSLNGQIVERSEDNPFASFFGEYTHKPTISGLDDILAAIKKAKSNSNIKGIYIESGSLMAAPATLREIRQALADFKTSGKFVYAFGSFYTQGAYYVSSVADKIYLAPEGMINWHGLSVQTTFFKGALDKLGIDMQVVRVGAYKSAVEPFITNKMSDANREQVTAFSHSIWQTVLGDVSASRKISVDKLNEYADQEMSFQPSALSVTYHLADSLLYDDGMQQILKQKLNMNKTEDISFVDLAAMKKAPDTEKLSKDKIAVVYAFGGIDDGDSDGINSDELIKTLADVRNNDKVKAVVLRINSPGGSALGSELIWREVSLMKAKKPVYVSMGDYAASGGYYISCAADTIIAQPNTITGSIGVFGLIPNISGLTKKLGLTFDGVKTNRLSDMPNVERAFTPEERNILQTYVNNTYATFVNHCAAGRRMTPDAVKKIAEGRVWTGEQAKAIGLVDQLGTLSDAVTLIAKRAHLAAYNVEQYPHQKTFFEKLMKGLDTKMETRVEKAQLGEYYEYLHQMRTVVRMKGVQARLPFFLSFE